MTDNPYTVPDDDSAERLLTDELAEAFDGAPIWDVSLKELLESIEVSCHYDALDNGDNVGDLALPDNRDRFRRAYARLVNTAVSS